MNEPIPVDPFFSLAKAFTEAKLQLIAASKAGTPATRLDEQLVTAVARMADNIAHLSDLSRQGQRHEAFDSPVAQRIACLQRLLRLSPEATCSFVALFSLSSGWAQADASRAPDAQVMTALGSRTLTPSAAAAEAISSQSPLCVTGVIHVEPGATWADGRVRIPCDIMEWLLFGATDARIDPPMDKGPSSVLAIRPRLTWLETTALSRPFSLGWVRVAAGQQGHSVLQVSTTNGDLPGCLRLALVHRAVLMIDARDQPIPPEMAARLAAAAAYVPTFVVTDDSPTWLPDVLSHTACPPIADQATIAAYARARLGTSTEAWSDFDAIDRAARIQRGEPGLSEIELQRRATPPQFSGLAKPMAADVSFEHVICDDDTKMQLWDILAAAHYHADLHEQWGLGAALPYGKAITALLSGPPGTGKTLACLALANTLKRPLYRVDLSAVVSKYIGETEKQLGRLFDEATRSGAILLFDEADALFAKRTDVKSSNDKHANLEVGYLLQRLEAHEGIVLLTTNHEAHLDPAFKRRLRFRVRFAAPDATTREALWRKLIPAQMTLADDVDLGALATAFPLSGGHLVNAIVRAATRARATGSLVTHAHLWNAAQTEYADSGRVA